MTSLDALGELAPASSREDFAKGGVHGVLERSCAEDPSGQFGGICIDIDGRFHDNEDSTMTHTWISRPDIPISVSELRTRRSRLS
jgi:hypothetical protein